MIPRKQIVTLNSATSKGKAINTIGGMVLPYVIDQLCSIKDTGSFSPQGAVANVQPSQQYEDELLQMLADMKEHRKEQQVQSDRDQEQANFNYKNAIREQEALRRLSNQLQAEIAAL